MKVRFKLRTSSSIKLFQLSENLQFREDLYHQTLWSKNKPNHNQRGYIKFMRDVRFPLRYSRRYRC